MKVLTLNFLTCAVRTCKQSSDSFPLHPKDAELASDDVELNPKLLSNLLPRLDWNALRTTSIEVCLWFLLNRLDPYVSLVGVESSLAISSLVPIKLSAYFIFTLVTLPSSHCTKTLP